MILLAPLAEVDFLMVSNAMGRLLMSLRFCLPFVTRYTFCSKHTTHTSNPPLNVDYIMKSS